VGTSPAARAEKGPGSFICTNGNKALPPGKAIFARMVLTDVGEAPEYRNCAAVQVVPGRPVDTTFPGQCVTVVNSASKKPNLKVNKTAPNAVGGNETPGQGTCSIKFGCRFRIDVTNNGSAPFVGPVEIGDLLQDNGGLTVDVIQQGPGSPAGIWSCPRATNTDRIKCISKPVTMNPGDTLTLEIQVIPVGPGRRMTS
jgi:hypothetical protein